MSEKLQNKPLAQRRPIAVAVADIVKLLLGPAAKEAGETLKNEVTAFKVKRLSRFEAQVQSEIEHQNLDRSKLSHLKTGTAVRVLESAAIEDDDAVLNLWAKLAVSGLDPKRPDIDKAFIGVLTNIGGAEVHILRFLRLRNEKNDTSFNIVNDNDVVQFAKKYLHIYPIKHRAIALQNLIRHQCIRLSLDRYYFDNIGLKDDSFTMTTSDNGSAGGTLSEIGTSLEGIQRLLENMSGSMNKHYLGLNDDPSQGNTTPEIAFELSEFGTELLSRCEPTSPNASG